MDSVGQQLKAAREDKKLTLKEAASRTQIKVQQLEALECDDFSAIPAPVYTRGFIKLYAKAMGVDGGALVEQFNASLLPREIPDVEVSTEVLDKRAVIEQDEDDKAATITHAKTMPLTGGPATGDLDRRALMERVGRYLPLVGALAVVLFLLFALKSCMGSSSTERAGGVNPAVFEKVSPLVAEPPEPYLKLE